MTNTQAYVFISIGCVLIVGAWSLYLAVMLDKAHKIIEQQKLQMLKMYEPPF